MTEPSNAFLTQLFAKGISSGELAKRFRLTRSTVIGRVHRQQHANHEDHQRLRACRMIDDGRTDDDIHESTGVRFEDIAELRREIATCQQGRAG